jgi:DNA-directed RNA polymerase specialized sigma24 family protein
MTTSVRRAAAGSGEPVPVRMVAPEALEEFHRRLFLPLARRAAWRHGLSEEDAKDVVQEAFVLAIVKLDPDGNPNAWFIGVVDRLAMGFRRKLARRALLAARWGERPAIEEAVSDPDMGGEF